MNSPLLVWMLYALCLSGLLLALGRLMGLLRLRWLRWPLLLFLGVLLLTPQAVPDQPDAYAPAVVAAGMQFLDGRLLPAWQALRVSLSLASLGVLLWLLLRIAVFLFRRFRRRPVSASPHSSVATEVSP